MALTNDEKKEIREFTQQRNLFTVFKFIRKERKAKKELPLEIEEVLLYNVKSKTHRERRRVRISRAWSEGKGEIPKGKGLLYRHQEKVYSSSRVRTSTFRATKKRDLRKSGLREPFSRNEG